MAKIIINTHNCSREELAELVDYLVENNWDFKKASERSAKLERLGKYVYSDDDCPLEQQLSTLENHPDPKDIAGWVTGVQMCQEFEYSFTVKSLLERIS